MTLDQIREQVKDNNAEVQFFMSLYEHSKKLLESIPDETMQNIIQKKRSCRKHGVEISYIDGFLFQNVIYDGKKSTNQIWFSTDVWYISLDKDDMYPEFEDCTKIDSSFDFRYLVINFSLSKDEVTFWRDTDGIEEKEIKNEDAVFLNALTKPEYLEAIFGEHLLNVVDSFFTVSTKFFK